MAVTWKVKGKGMFNGERVFSSEYFVKNNCVSCGWGAPALENEEKVKDFYTYKEKWLDMYGSKLKWGYQGVHHLFESIKKGDYIWTRLYGEYYVAQIPDNPIELFRIDNSIEAVKYDSVVQLKNIKWIKCGTEESVPGSVSSFSSNRNSLVRVDRRECIQDGYTATSLFSSRIINANSIDRIIDRRMIFNLIGPSGFEDLIAIWLFDKFNYFVIPSTNKISTQKYEFVLLDGTKENGKYRSKKRIYLQAKNGNIDLRITDYESLLNEVGDEVWLVTSGGKIYNSLDSMEEHQIVQFRKTSSSIKMSSINLNELVEFVFDDHKKEIMPDSILTMIELFV
jgi:hypothetical protein